MTAPTYPDIAAFLVAQLDREQAIAEAANTVESRTPYSDRNFDPVPPEGWGDLARDYLGGDFGEHCAEHSPVKVLADIAAKRAIVAAIWWVKGCNSMDDLPASDAKTETGWRVVCHLAAPFADQPGYRPEWAVG